jgi:ribonuclease BN (tRNA processing enzyme)
LVYHFPIWPTYAFRFDTHDGSVVFSGDTNPSKNLIRLARNADVLVHEVIDVAWIEALFPPATTAREDALKAHLLNSHNTIDDVGAIAEEATARQWC